MTYELYARRADGNLVRVIVHGVRNGFAANVTLLTEDGSKFRFEPEPDTSVPFSARAGREIIAGAADADAADGR
jgi:hypothetical protein